MSLIPRTQDHLDILDVKDDILILVGGKFRLVFEASAINFDLLSEDEQNSTIFAYANLVNSIDYPVQILVRTRQVDITGYLKFLDSQIHEQPSGPLREQLQDYIDFIKQLVLQNTVLQKRFFVVLPFFQANNAQTANQPVRKKSPLPFLKPKELGSQSQYTPKTLAKAKADLEQKFQELKWQFNRLGIKIKQLNTEELIRLFYEVYNPESGENEGIKQDAPGYTTAVVRSNIVKPGA